jgi:hypothetical protein
MLTPLIYVIASVFFIFYFVIVVFIQGFKNLCVKNTKVFHFGTGLSALKSFDASSRFLDNAKEKEKMNPAANSPLISSVP